MFNSVDKGELIQAIRKKIREGLIVEEIINKSKSRVRVGGKVEKF